MKNIQINKIQLFFISVAFVFLIAMCPSVVHAQVPEWGLYVPDNPTPPSPQSIIDFLHIDASEKNVYIVYQPVADWYDYWVFVSDIDSPGIIYRPSINGDRGWLMRPLSNTTGSRTTYAVSFNKNRPNGLENSGSYPYWLEIYISPNEERLATSYTHFPIFTNTVAYLFVDGEEETDNYAFVSQEYIDNLPDTSLDDLLNSSIFGNGQITGHAKPPENIDDTTIISNSTDGFLQKIYNRLGKIGNDINGYLDNFLGNLETFFTPFLQSINKGIGSIFQKINDTLAYVFEPLDTTSVLDAFSGTLLYQLYDSSGSIGGLLKSLLTYTTPVPSLSFDIDYDFLGLEGTIILDFDWYNEIREDFLNVFLPFFYFGYAFYFIKQLPNIIGGISSGVNRHGD